MLASYNPEFHQSTDLYPSCELKQNLRATDQRSRSNSKWHCPLGCGKHYCKSSSRSIQKHRATCFETHMSDYLEETQELFGDDLRSKIVSNVDMNAALSQSTNGNRVDNYAFPISSLSDTHVHYFCVGELNGSIIATFRSPLCNVAEEAIFLKCSQILHHASSPESQLVQMMVSDAELIYFYQSVLVHGRELVFIVVVSSSYRGDPVTPTLGDFRRAFVKKQEERLMAEYPGGCASFAPTKGQGTWEEGMQKGFSTKEIPINTWNGAPHKFNPNVGKSVQGSIVNKPSPELETKEILRSTYFGNGSSDNWYVKAVKREYEASGFDSMASVGAGRGAFFGGEDCLDVDEYQLYRNARQLGDSKRQPLPTRPKVKWHQIDNHPAIPKSHHRSASRAVKRRPWNQRRTKNNPLENSLEGSDTAESDIRSSSSRSSKKRLKSNASDGIRKIDPDHPVSA